MRRTPSPIHSRRAAARRSGGTGRALAAAALIAALGLFAGASSAQETQQFNDWTLSCATPEGGSQEICQIGQVVSNKETQNPVLAAAIRYVPGNDRPLMELTVPLGVLLPQGIGVQIDESENTGRVPFLVCTPRGCSGVWRLDDQALAALKKGLRLKITVMGAQEQPVTLPVSLRGFTAALNALGQKRS